MTQLGQDGDDFVEEDKLIHNRRDLGMNKSAQSNSPLGTFLPCLLCHNFQAQKADFNLISIHDTFAASKTPSARTMSDGGGDKLVIGCHIAAYHSVLMRMVLR